MILSQGSLEITFKGGDMFHIKVFIGGHVVFEREIDVIKGA